MRDENQNTAETSTRVLRIFTKKTGKVKSYYSKSPSITVGSGARADLRISSFSSLLPEHIIVNFDRREITAHGPDVFCGGQLLSSGIPIPFDDSTTIRLYGLTMGFYLSEDHKEQDIKRIEAAATDCLVEGAINTRTSTTIEEASPDDQDGAAVSPQVVPSVLSAKTEQQAAGVGPSKEAIEAYIDRKIEQVDEKIVDAITVDVDASVKRHRPVDLSKTVLDREILENAKEEVAKNGENEVLADIKDGVMKEVKDNIKEEMRRDMTEMVHEEVQELLTETVADCLNASVSTIANQVLDKIEGIKSQGETHNGKATGDNHSNEHITEDNHSNEHITQDNHSNEHITEDNHSNEHITEDNHSNEHITQDNHSSESSTSTEPLPIKRTKKTESLKNKNLESTRQGTARKKSTRAASAAARQAEENPVPERRTRRAAAAAKKNARK